MAKELGYQVDARWERVPHPIVSLPGKASPTIIPRQKDSKEAKPLLCSLLCFLRSLGGFHRFVLIADSVYGLQIVQWHFFALKEIPNLDNVLIERATSNVRMYTPNRVYQILSSDDGAGVVVKIG